jgi:hypothetical protein
MRSWRTTTAGIASIVAAVSTALVAITDNDPLTVPDWGALGALLALGLGLVAARDNKVSSEEANKPLL